MRHAVAVSGFVLLVPLAAARLPAAQAGAPVRSEALAALAPRLELGERVTLGGVEVPASDESLTLELERFAVFTADAAIVVHRDGGRERRLAPPDTVYLRGSVAGEQGSRAFLERQADGRVRGIVMRPGDHLYLIDAAPPAPGAAAAPLQAERVDGALLKRAGKPWTCGDEQLRPPADARGWDPTQPAPPLAAAAELAEKATVAHTARIAIETDYEFLHLPPFGGSTVLATGYIGTLVGFVSTIYVNELSTSLQVQSVSLWDVASSAADPWSQSSTLCELVELSRYWNKNHAGVQRALVHFLSGRDLGGGIAWRGTLCKGALNGAATCPGIPTDSTPWAGAYAFSSDIDGTFSPTDPGVAWDSLVFAHETGHVFGSIHSHCFNGVAGSSSPIDQCFSGEQVVIGNNPPRACYSGPISLPGPQGAGSGTIMSYCHAVLPGGLEDISLNFGTGQPYGVQPQREAAELNRMIGLTASDPATKACLAAAPSTAPCVRSATTACLDNGSVEVKVTYQSDGGATGSGQVMSFNGQRAESDQSVFFYFFNPANYEVGVKVLDACALNGKFWVFTGGLTDRGYTVSVRNTVNGATKTLSNALGHVANGTADTSTGIACH